MPSPAHSRIDPSSSNAYGDRTAGRISGPTVFLSSLTRVAREAMSLFATPRRYAHRGTWFGSKS